MVRSLVIVLYAAAALRCGGPTELTAVLRELPPPTSAPPSRPSIDWLVWDVSGPTGGGPLPGETTSVGCGVSDADGDAATVTLTVTWEGTPPQTVSRDFAAGATSSAEGARLELITGARGTANPPRALAKCTAVDARGSTATRSVTIP